MTPLRRLGARTGETPCLDRRGRILIVDDHPEKLIALEAALESLGHEIVTAGSGADALRCLLEHEMAVILLDVNMPGMDGFETARLIRSRRRNTEIPIIFISAYCDELHALRGYTMGAIDFIQAPVVPRLLRSKVSVILELFERTSQVREHAERLLLQTRQLQALTQASLRIHSTLSIEQTVQVAADSARAIVGTRFAAAQVTISQGGLREQKLEVSPACHDSSASGRPRRIDLGPLQLEPSRCRRLTPLELAAPGLPALLPAEIALRADSGLALPLVSRDGNQFGALLVIGKEQGEFCEDDEALVMQLAQMTATAVENALFAESRELNRVKDEFLATLSHELRTPLSSILGWTQLLQTGLLNADETTEAIEIIERNAQMQCKLIEDLLDVSRIIAGKMQLKLRSIRLAPVLDAAVDVVLPAARAKGIEIDRFVERDHDRVAGDADRLQQVFWNLLSNAVKFTPGPGRIELRLETDDQYARITVQDDGQGIDPEFLPHVFDRFRQADGSSNRAHGGLGIGLAIVRHVVELHGGHVKAVSEGQGRGTAFTVVLPLASGDAESTANTELTAAGPAVEFAAQPAGSRFEPMNLCSTSTEGDHD